MGSALLAHDIGNRTQNIVQHILLGSNFKFIDECVLVGASLRQGEPRMKFFRA